MKPQTSQKEVFQFITVVNYYRNMCKRGSHTLAPLTNIMSNKVKFKWIKIKQYAFDEIKRILARDTLLAYPYLMNNLIIHTDARYVQLGAVISYKFKPISF